MRKSQCCSCNSETFEHTNIWKMKVCWMFAVLQVIICTYNIYITMCKALNCTRKVVTSSNIHYELQVINPKIAQSLLLKGQVSSKWSGFSYLQSHVIFFLILVMSTVACLSPLRKDPLFPTLWVPHQINYRQKTHQLRDGISIANFCWFCLGNVRSIGKVPGDDLAIRNHG